MTGGNWKFHSAFSLLSLIAITSLMLVPVEKLVSVDTGLSPLAIRAVALINPAMLMIAALTAGHFLAPKVGLDAPFIRSWASGKTDFTVLGKQLGPGLAGAILVAILLFLHGSFSQPRIEAAASPEAAALIEFGLPPGTRLLYGGIGEEIIMRWGLMSLVAWTGWRMIGRTTFLSPSTMWAAIAITALLFGLGHLPFAFAIMDNPSSVIIGAIIGSNAVAATIFGWLFWKYGLESAMFAHIGAHIIGIVAGT